MKKILLVLIGTLMAISSIHAKEEVNEYKYSTSEARLLDFSPTVAPTPLTVDIKVIGQRIHETVNLNSEELSTRIIDNNYGKTIENLRSWAVFVVTGKYDCDLLVGARFNFNVTNNGASIEVFGYPANFVNWGGKGDSLPVAKEVYPNYPK